MIRGYFTTAEAGRILGVSDSRIRQLYIANILKGEKVGEKTLVISAASLERYQRQKANGNKTNNTSR